MEYFAYTFHMYDHGINCWTSYFFVLYVFYYTDKLKRMP